MEMKFTPGPWEYKTAIDGDDKATAKHWCVGLSNEYGNTGCRGNEYMRLGGICSEADARLIAAAPEMLFALSHALIVVDRLDGVAAGLVRSEIRAVIEKATGGKP